MKCSILHESAGRLRVRLHCPAMTLRQADVLEYYLRAVDGVTEVKVYDRTRDAVVCFACGRGDVIASLAAFSFPRAEAMDLVPEHTSRALNREFEDKLIMTVARRMVSRLFLPAPVTTALAVIRSVKYIREGLSALWHGRLSVAVLDATAVTVSMARGDFATAGSVMFMLRLGEILEEWTHKKSVADLAGAMSLHVDQVWLQTGGAEVLTPISYREIVDALDEKATEYDGFMSSIHDQITQRLEEAHIDGYVYGRMKHPYSIYRKMYTQNKSLDDVYDLFAFRVIVDTVSDCYYVLGIIHDLYKPVLGRFKDYIGTPKPNMYQSLHTTVMGQNGVPFEVQIRTKEMHEVAEYGIAAHWKYKQNGQGGGDEGRYEWVRRLLENQEGADAEEFIHSLKVDMFADEVFVFTPRGDVINLPAGATPIDFAYNIHSAVGNHMVAAKVNGRIVPFDCRLKNGDIVEVITSQSAHGPSRDWVKIARSSNARSKIRQWLKRERRDENVVTGRASFESELKRCGVSLKELTNDENLPGILKKLTYKSLDDLYAAIGYGGISSLKVIGRIREDIQRILHQHQEERQAEVPLEGRPDATRPAVPKRTHSEKGIIVEGLSNCLVKFSKCCTPVPGDDIVGFITKGYGVSVHRRDCPNADPARRRPDEEGRWIKVSWAEDVEGTFRTTLQVVAKDRINLIVDISTVLSSTKTHVASMNARSTPDGFVLITLDTDVSSSQQLKTVMRRIEQISGVMRVTRPAG